MPNRAKLPSQIRVGPHVYRVLRKPAAQMPKEAGMPSEGLCRFNELEIWIKKNLRRSKVQETLLHEVEHACTYPDMIGRRMTDEEFITYTAPNLLAVLQDNQELVTYLTDREDER